MSAREDIDALLKSHGVSKTARQSVQILMGAFAHELAEEIRRVFDHPYEDMAYHAADFIDPKA